MNSLKQLPQNVAVAQIHGEVAVNTAIATLAEQITNELGTLNPLVITVLNGGAVLTGKLLPLLEFPLQQDYLHASRYGDAVLGKKLSWYAYPTSSLKERVVLLLDDIFDQGFTLEAVRDYCLSQGATKVYSAVLVEKIFDTEPEGGASQYTPDFIGLNCPDSFVVGSGMDYQGYGRNIAGIYEIVSGHES